MLPKKNRLSRKDFVLVLDSKNKGTTTHFFLKKGLGTDLAKIAVSVSKKVSKRAVDRNSIRRRVYSVLKPMLGGLSGSYLFVAKKGAEKIRGEELLSEIKTLLNSVKKG